MSEKSDFQGEHGATKECLAEKPCFRIVCFNKPRLRKTKKPAK